MMTVTHKNASIPEMKGYYPMLVGPKKDELVFSTYFRDDQAENIAKKNANYSELTALYWAWKNLDADYIGLTHYRRYFMSAKNKQMIVSIEELSELFEQVDIILPKKRNYYIETTWSHYQHNHNIEDLLKTKSIITNKYPEYLLAFEAMMKRRKSHRFNMLIMKKDKFDAYCDWLFAILSELETQVDLSSYDAYQTRIYGFISERLLDVWLTQKQYSYRELPFKFTEKQNWLKKGTHFVKAKYARQASR